jgi:hypothetical protein
MYMHKGKNHTVKKRGKRSQLKGGMGAGEYVSSVYGDLTAQMNNASAHNVIQSIPVSAPASHGGQHGGRKSMRKRRVKKGGNIYHPLNPAELQEPGHVSDGQKGGYFANLLERAAVPFGLMALQRFSKTMKHRKSSKK